MKQRRNKLQIGSVIEIQTSRGLAYAQYSHYLPGTGELVRVLPGFHAERPKSFDHLVASKERFFVFYPVGAAVKQSLVSIVAQTEVPEESQEFPLMRARGLPEPDGSVNDWWLVDGKKDRYLGRLTPELERLSIAETWGHPVLVQRITEDWSPSSEIGKKKANATRKGPESIPKKVNFYLYSPDKKVAKEVSRVLKEEGHSVEVRKAADGSNWLILVSSLLNPSTDVGEMSSRLERLATSFGITYDGEEIQL